LKPGRNDPCPCGSGKKYKKCCQNISEFDRPTPGSIYATEPTPFECNQLATLFNAGRFVELEKQARLLAKQYPKSGFVWKVLGASLQMQSKDALDAMQKAMELLPDDAEAHINLGNALKSQGRLEDAVVSYSRALEIKPDFAEAHYNLGDVLRDLGRLDDAVASYRQALEIKPDFVEAYGNLGWVLMAQGKLDDAVANYRRALEIKPNDAEAHINLGNALRYSGKLDDALVSYLMAVELKPDFAGAHYNLGNAQRDLGRFDEAIASYRRTLELKPDFAEAHGSLGRALMTQGTLDDALACFQRQLELTPANEETQHLIAALTGNTTDRAPVQYVESVFDSYAATFDTHLRQVLKYDAPEKLAAIATQHATLPLEKWNVLDLGCGTGLVGMAIAPFARQLVGVDLSTRMLEKARTRNVYQRLEHLDLLAMMQGEKASSYDVIIAADVFIYLGKLDDVVSEAKRLLRPGGVLAFSVESPWANEEVSSPSIQQDYQLENTGRYTQSAGYISRLASTNNFMSKEMTAVQIRLENNKSVNGYLVVWKS